MRLVVLAYWLSPILDSSAHLRSYSVLGLRYIQRWVGGASRLYPDERTPCIVSAVLSGGSSLPRDAESESNCWLALAAVQDGYCALSQAAQQIALASCHCQSQIVSIWLQHEGVERKSTMIDCGSIGHQPDLRDLSNSPSF
ncbi:uncharacterized protein BDV17DRAFT_176089 [Aspergillus undulatus]|uniref:uncharacterized protein n=1 Tax=Aspergillus undulatus TaxID=1810928 RepID=UPI003CCD921D